MSRATCPPTYTAIRGCSFGFRKQTLVSLQAINVTEKSPDIFVQVQASPQMSSLDEQGTTNVLTITPSNPHPLSSCPRWSIELYPYEQKNSQQQQWHNCIEFKMYDLRRNQPPRMSFQHVHLLQLRHLLLQLKFVLGIFIRSPCTETSEAVKKSRDRETERQTIRQTDKTQVAW